MFQGRGSGLGVQRQSGSQSWGFCRVPGLGGVSALGGDPGSGFGGYEGLGSPISAPTFRAAVDAETRQKKNTPGHSV